MRKTILIIAFLLALPLGYKASMSLLKTNTNNEQGGKQNAVNNASEEYALEVKVNADKQVYRQGEAIRLEVLLLNTGEEAVYLYSYLSWGLSSSFSLQIMDQSGKETPARYLDDALTPPPPPDDMRFFVHLLPQHIFGTIRESSLDELNINRTGKYKIVVEYHSPIPKSYSQKLSIWARERGTIKSKPIEVEVVSAK